MPRRHWSDARLSWLGEPLSVRKNDVIQLEDDQRWGPMLCIVDEVTDRHVLAYWLVAEAGEPPGRAYIRAEHGHYTVIGPAAWIAVPESNLEDTNREPT